MNIKLVSYLLTAALLTIGAGPAAGSSHDQAQMSIDARLRRALDNLQVLPVAKPKPANPDQLELGRLLFWDKIISGNKNISCATCHLPEAGTSDALPLSIGEGGKGSMKQRSLPENQADDPIFVPRNATDLFNREKMLTMFWDGRVMARRDGRFLAPVSGSDAKQRAKYWNPAGMKLPAGLESALAVQAMFPVTSDTEMRGDFHENPLGALQKWEWQNIWDGLMSRLLAIPEYAALFKKVYPHIAEADLSFVQAANALAAFELEAFTLIDAPFDNYLRGDNHALSTEQKRGALIFYGKGYCADCHAGTLLTDQIFHNRVVPQIGPGKGDGPPGGADGTWDLGRGGVTGWADYYYHFRTPPLRNVEKTGPWMHDGAYSTLEATVRHELNPIHAAMTYDAKANLPKRYQDSAKLAQTTQIASMAKVEDTRAVSLNDHEVQELIAFLKALTSPTLEQLIKLVPKSVPSGLPVED